MEQVLLFRMSVVAGLALLAAVFDIRQFRVPDWLTGAMLVAGLAYHMATDGWEGLALSATGTLVGLALPFAFYILGGMGAGDVKFMAAAGAWLGPGAAVLLFGLAGLATGVYAIGLAVWYGGMGRMIATMHLVALQMLTIGKHLGGAERVEEVVRHPERRKRLVPFTAMVTLGAILVLVWQAWGRGL